MVVIPYFFFLLSFTLKYEINSLPIFRQKKFHIKLISNFTWNFYFSIKDICSTSHLLILIFRLYPILFMSSYEFFNIANYVFISKNCSFFLTLSSFIIKFPFYCLLILSIKRKDFQFLFLAI